MRAAVACQRWGGFAPGSLRANLGERGSLIYLTAFKGQVSLPTQPIKGRNLFDINDMGKIRFLHIPKTAGTSFSNCLRRIYKANRFKNNVFVFLGDFPQDLSRYQRLDAAERSRITVVSGHAPLVTGVTEIDRLPTLTFLRDPVERVKSACQYLSEGRTGTLPPGNFDLDGLFAEEGNLWLRNLQTRMLLGVQGYDLPAGDPRRLVEQALEVLQGRLACFGITEYFDDSLLLFQQALRWKRYPVYTKLNQRNPGKLLRFSASQLDWIREANAIDIQLYEGAVRLFHARIAASSAEIEARRRVFSIQQTLYQPLLGLYKFYHQGQSILSRRHGKPGA